METGVVASPVFIRRKRVHVDVDTLHPGAQRGRVLVGLNRALMGHFSWFPRARHLLCLLVRLYLVRLRLLPRVRKAHLRAKMESSGGLWVADITCLGLTPTPSFDLQGAHACVAWEASVILG